MPTTKRIAKWDNLKLFLIFTVVEGHIADTFYEYCNDMKSVFLIDDNPYNEIKEAYDFAQYDKFVPEHFSRIELVKSYFNITKYGRLFINACTNK